MTKNLHSLIDSVEEKTEDSKKGRRQPQQTLKMVPTLPAFPVLNYCTLHQLLPHTIHWTYSPESHPYPHIAYLTLPQFLPSSKADHHTCTHIDCHTSFMSSSPSHCSSLMSSLTLTLNNMLLICIYCTLCIELAPLAIHCIYPILTLFTHMSPICCAHLANVYIPPIPYNSLPIWPLSTPAALKTTISVSAAAWTVTTLALRSPTSEFVGQTW